MKVCCIIPAYQESRAIDQVITIAQKYCTHVVVVDDGSTDNTGKIAEANGATVLRHPTNLGKGAALRTGFNYSIRNQYDVIITLDGDLQHNPHSIPRFLEKIKQGYDIIVGSRYQTQSKDMPFARKLSNLITTTVLRVLFKVPVTDSQSGYRAFKRRVLETIPVRDNGFAAETEILIDAQRAGFLISEVPIATSYGEEESKIRAGRDISRWLATLGQYLFYRPRFLSQNE
ncbi:MAG: glycosyltransferase family 2 protein [Candidatus Hermodarchaeota archaeon]|nr:glycosyltransferase family 2 protein [Candidatus Hermodarchaeota archaeon]